MDDKSPGERERNDYGIFVAFVLVLLSKRCENTEQVKKRKIEKCWRFVFFGLKCIPKLDENQRKIVKIMRIV